MKEEQIAKAAKTLFSKYGFKKVSMDEIAMTAKVTKKTVYTYFSSKEELLKYLINQEMKNMRKAIEKAENQDDNFFESVHKGIYNILQYRKKSNLLKTLVREAEFFRDEALIKDLEAIELTIRAYIKEKLDFAIQNKYIYVQNVEVMTFLIYKMYIALFVEWNENTKDIDEEELANTVMQVLKNGIKRKEV